MIAHSNKQRGATLVTTLVLVALLTLLAIYGVGISVLDQRSSANEFRAKEAGAAADGAIEQGIAYLQANRAAVSGWTWTNCTSADANCSTIDPDDRLNWKWATPNISPVQPYTNGFSLVFLSPNSGASEEMLFNIVATGISSDGGPANGGASKLIQQGAFFYPIIVGEVNAPMVASGGISFNGNYSVVVNPNGTGAGTGVPLSAWSGSNITIGTGSPSTCYVQDFLSTSTSHTTVTDNNGNTLTMCPTCVCPIGDLSKAGVEGKDILDVDGNAGYNRDTTTFPSDVFQYMFGVPTADYLQVKQMATVVSDCSALDATSSGFYWVTGNCSIGSNVGSFANPVLLVVEGNLSMNGAYQVFGIIFIFSTNPAASLSVTLNGGPTLYGAVMTNANISLPVGTFKMRYDGNVISNLKNNLTGRALTKVPGSWADFSDVE